MTACAFFAVAPAASAQTSAWAPGAPMGLIFSTWVKLCSETAGSSARRRCFTHRDSRSESGEWLATGTIVEADDRQQTYFALKMPGGVALEHGAWLTVDRDQPWTAPAVNCMASPAVSGGYVAFCRLTTSLIERMKEGRVLTVQGTQRNGGPLHVQFELQGFARAFDGPPTEFRGFAKQQRMRPDEPQPRIRDDTLQPHLRPWN